MRGVAHISFAGGGVFLPARNPYDREILAEHVADRVRCKGEVQVALDDRCWSVSLSAVGASCSHCGHPLDSACSSPTSGVDVLCVKCAFGQHGDQT